MKAGNKRPIAMQFLTTMLCVAFCLPAVAEAQQRPAKPAAAPENPPTLAHVPYGTHPRQVLDFWKARSDRPAPLLFYIHGGGWQQGDKSKVGDVKPYLDAGISVVAINYRYVKQAAEEKVAPPVKGPLYDAARALQFVRSNAAKWHIDKQRIGASGSSAGACTSLWLAFHPDLADPKSTDPIARESTRLWCAAVFGAQTTLDPKQMKEWTPNSRYGGHAFGFLRDQGERTVEFDKFLANREKILPWIEEYSPYALVTGDDPPIYLQYAAPPAMGKAQKDPTHTANFGAKLQEKCRSVGVPCELAYPGAPDVAHSTAQKFLIEKLSLLPPAGGQGADAKLLPIFNGQDLGGFRVPNPNVNWTVQDGVLIGASDPQLKGGMLWTEKLFQDVIVETEFRFTGEIDSGIMIRQPEIQVQIGVSRSLKKDMTGSIYAHGKYPGQAQGVEKLLKVGDWNTLRFQAKGSTFDVWLNGQHVLTYHDQAFPQPAPIGLQIHPHVAMKIEFRSLKAAALNDVPASATWTHQKPPKKNKPKQGQQPATRVALSKLADRVRVEIDGQLFTEYQLQGRLKPILYPIIGPHGLGMTRNWPLKDAPGEAHDHPHHESLWYSHGNANGVNFWKSHTNRYPCIEQVEILASEGGPQGTLKTRNHWLVGADQIVLTDTRTLRFIPLGDDRAIDYEITLAATHGDVTFADDKEGSMAIRTHTNLQLKNDPRHGVTSANGRAVNSEGVRDAAVWGKRAAWVDYWGTIEGRTVGIAIFDHPSNPRHPTTWHARDYGLVAANPFGLSTFEGKPKGTGDMKIPAGQSVTFRYRFLFHNGNAQAGKVAARYQEFKAEK